MSEKIIEIKNLNKQFKDAKVLKDITMNFEEGKIHGVIGRNGYGKTLLFKCICGLLPMTSGYKNLLLLSKINKIIGKEEIIESMKLVGLDPSSRKHVGKYSLGMRQRLGIAQAVMEKNSILILDEPMNGLDKEGLNDMRELFKKLRDEGKTILIASHSTEDIDILCDTVCEMDKGVLEVIR